MGLMEAMALLLLGCAIFAGIGMVVSARQYTCRRIQQMEDHDV